MGVSSCRLSEKVRFDVGHKRGRFLTDTLGQCFGWMSACSEVEVCSDCPHNQKLRDPQAAQQWTGAMVKPG
jgi:uncharacterized protein YbbK (DUF523 family)